MSEKLSVIINGYNLESLREKLTFQLTRLVKCFSSDLIPSKRFINAIPNSSSNNSYIPVIRSLLRQTIKKQEHKNN